MTEIYISPKVLKKSKIHHTLIKKAALKAKDVDEKEGNFKSDKRPQTVEFEGHKILIVYKNNDDGDIVVRNARYAKR